MKLVWELSLNSGYLICFKFHYNLFRGLPMVRTFLWFLLLKALLADSLELSVLSIPADYWN